MIGFVDVLVVVLSAAFALALITATRGICYFYGHLATDNEKLVQAAGEIDLLAWPSKMHTIPYGRSHLREYWVIALKLLMKITGMKGSDHVNITLALIANAFSAVLIFYVARSYFGEWAALFVFLLYVTCLWPYHVAIYMGHIHLAQAFFLSSVLALRLATVSPHLSLLFYLASGILIAVSFASSSSSRKFPALFLAAFLYETSSYFALPSNSDLDISRLLDGWTVLTLALPVLLLAGVAAAAGALRKSGRQLLRRRLGEDWSTSNPTLVSLGGLASKNLVRFAILSGAAILALHVWQPDARFYASVIVSLTGIVLVLVHVLSPDFIGGYHRYSLFLNTTGWASHFKVWKPRHQEIFGRTLPDDFRGGGISWVPRLLVRMTPVVAVIYVVGAVVMLGAYLSRGVRGDLPMIEALSIPPVLVLISLLPVFVAELTKSLQVGKAYFSMLVGLLVLIGAAAAAIIDVADNSPIALGVLALAAAVVILAQASITIRGLVADLLPARMGPSRLYRFLKDHKVRTFYTYDNPYNQPFVETMVYSHPGEFEVKYIDSIKDVGDGIVVVPPTSSKSLTMESDSFGVNGAFLAFLRKVATTAEGI